MEKVYVVYEFCIYGYEDTSLQPKVFKHLSDAKKYMKKTFEDTCCDLPICDMKHEGELMCETWQDGNSSENQYKIKIVECEIR